LPHAIEALTQKGHRLDLQVQKLVLTCDLQANTSVGLPERPLGSTNEPQIYGPRASSTTGAGGGAQRLGNWGWRKFLVYEAALQLAYHESLVQP